MIIENAYEHTIRALNLQPGDVVVTESCFNGNKMISIDFVLSATNTIDDEMIDIVCFHHVSSEIMTFSEQLDSHIDILSSIIRKT